MKYYIFKVRHLIIFPSIFSLVLLSLTKPSIALDNNILFSGRNFNYYTVGDLPTVDDTGIINLTEDDRYGQGVAIVSNEDISNSFETQFEFQTYDNDGSGSIWNKADGVAFFFAKDGSNYGDPPTGSRVGVRNAN